MDAKFHRQDGGIELRHRQPKVCHDPRLPVLRKALFNQHRCQIIYATAKDREHSRRVRTSEHVVEQTLRVLAVLRPRRSPPLAQRPAQIGFCEKPLSTRASTCSTVEKFSDEIQIWLSLVGYES